MNKHLAPTLALAVAMSGSGYSQAAREAGPLVLDVRVFETRMMNPDRDAMRELDFFIATDGRSVTANEWLATIAQKVPGAFLAALAFETVRVEKHAAHVGWTAFRARALDMDIDLVADHPPRDFKANVKTTFSRAGRPLRQLEKEVVLQLSHTTVWSAEELEIPLTDYISQFREYADREHRGLLYEELRGRSIFLVVAITPRRLAEDELPQLAPEELSPPSGAVLPEIDNTLGVPVRGTVTVGFEISPSGSPLNPQIVSSSLPEANPRLLGAIARWTFPPSSRNGNRRRWGRVEVSVELP